MLSCRIKAVEVTDKMMKDYDVSLENFHFTKLSYKSCASLTEL